MISIRYQFVPYLWVSLCITIIIIALIIYIWKNRSVLGAPYFLSTLILVEIWVAAQGLEIAALDLPTKIIWANIQYISIMLTPVTYFYLALKFTRYERPKSTWLPILLLVFPIALNILLWTDGFHGLIRQNIYLSTEGAFPMISKTFGPLFWAFATYNFTFNIITLIILANTFKEKAPLYREQAIFLFIALLLPVISTAVHVSGLNPFIVDTTPTVFGLSAIIISWGAYRYRLFAVIPIARSIIIQNMSIGMIVLDNKGRLLDINPAAKEMLSIKTDKYTGFPIETVLHEFPDLLSIYKEGNEAVCETVFVSNGKCNHFEVSFTKLTDTYHKLIGWLLQIYNITERKVAESVIRHAAFHDALTGLPNRNCFKVLFAQELERAITRGENLTIAYLDLDDFKAVNDRYGHDVGDSLLCEIAQRLKDALRESDIISRIGGDEFTIILPSAATTEKIDIIGQKIMRVFENTFDLQGLSLMIKASIGFSVFPRDGDNIDVLLRKADQAMYMAKNGTKESSVSTRKTIT